MEAINLTGCEVAAEMRGLLKRDDNRIARLTEKYLEYLLTFLDEGDEIPYGMEIEKDISHTGKTILKKLTLYYECERNGEE